MKDFIKISYYQDGKNWAAINHRSPEYLDDFDMFGLGDPSSDPNDAVSRFGYSLMLGLLTGFPCTETVYWCVDGKVNQYAVKFDRLDNRNDVYFPAYAKYSEKLKKILMFCGGGIGTVNAEGKFQWIKRLGDDNHIQMHWDGSLDGSRFAYCTVVSGVKRRFKTCVVDLQSGKEIELDSDIYIRWACFQNNSSVAIKVGDDVIIAKFDAKGKIRYEILEGKCRDKNLCGYRNGKLILKEYDDDDEKIILYYGDSKTTLDDNWSFHFSQQAVFLTQSTYQGLHDEPTKVYHWLDNGRQKYIGQYNDSKVISSGQNERGYWKAFEDGTVKVFTPDGIIDEKINLSGMKK
ncbi:MAG: hypothetical protein JEZ07_15570 [Phycisphaerae bacterium]|nr:hypothetical protein [Phycisphaerae bacterium]